MLRTFRLLLLISTFSVLGGCTTLPVESNVTSFHSFGENAGPQGSIAIIPAEGIKDGLEFRSYAGLALGWLQKKGLTPAASVGSADYVGVLTYAINEGHQELVSSPILGQTGGGSSVTTGSFGYATTYSPATFGVVGARTDSVRVFTRVAELRIKERRSGREVWVGRNRSVGGNGELAAVLPTMIRAMLQNFPNDSGKTKFVRIYE